MIRQGVSAHAQARLQQRAIPPLVLDLLQEFGSGFRSHGAERLIFDKAAVKRLKRHLGGDRGLRVIERWLRVYAVVGDSGHLVTVAHRTRHLRRF